MSEAHSKTLGRPKMNKEIDALKITRSVEGITHLLYVDDLIIFGKVNLIKDTIMKYSESVGRKMSFDYEP